MRLRAKTILLTSFIAGVLVAGLGWATRALLLEGFQRVEHSDTERNIERTQQALSMKIASISLLLKDWAFWDDAYSYVQDPGSEAGQDFAATNLSEEMFSSTKLDMMAFATRDKRLVDTMQYDPQNDTKAAMSEELRSFLVDPANPFYELKDSDSAREGIVMTSRGPLILCSRLIYNSLADKPPQGVLFFGKFVDDAALASLREVTQLELAIATITPKGFSRDYQEAFQELQRTGARGHVVPRDERIIRGYTLVKDYAGKPAFLMRIEVPREISLQGLRTLRVLIISLVALSVVFVIGILAMLEFAIIARVKHLSDMVHRIEKEGDLKLRTTDTGNDEIRDLGDSINAMVETIQTATRRLKDILDNVQFGFFVTNSKGVIQPGSTKSCALLFNCSEITSCRLDQVLGLNERDGGHFLWMLEQVFDDILPESMSLQQLPKRFRVNGRTLNLSGSVIRGEDGTVSSVLFCLSDISELEQAERENQNNRVLLRILSLRQAFADLLDDTRAGLAQIQSALARNDQATARRVLHTLKGNFGFFGLTDVSHRIHDLEGAERIGNDVVGQIEGLVSEFLDRNKPIIGLDYHGQGVEVYQVNRHDLEEFEQYVDRHCNDVPGLLEGIGRFCHVLRVREIGEAASSLQGVVEQVSARLGKMVRFVMHGTKLRTQLEPLKPLIATLPHVLRNAVDHGIEHDWERGEKDPVGTVMVSFSGVDNNRRLKIEVSDDGRGLNLERIRGKVVEMGLHTPEEVACMSDSDVAMMVMFDGVSTAETVTDISGRGVGMGAVSAEVRRLGGELRINSTPGKGLRLEILVPISVHPALESAVAVDGNVQGLSAA